MLTVHLVLCFIALLAGVVALIALCKGRDHATWAAALLVSSALISITGLLLPSPPGTPTPDPARILSVLELIVVAVATIALFYARARPGRITYAIAMVVAVYFNVFVAVTQAFLKIPALSAVAPTGQEPPALACQFVVLILLVIVGFRAAKRAAHREGTALKANTM
jgi:hypothetical protein